MLIIDNIRSSTSMINNDMYMNRAMIHIHVVVTHCSNSSGSSRSSSSSSSSSGRRRFYASNQSNLIPTP